MVARIQSAANSKDEYLSTTAFLECRADGHAWERTHRNWLMEGSARSTIYTKHMKCARCDQRKIERRNWRFERLHPRVEYPEGYLASGLGLTKDDVVRYEISAAKAESTRRARSRVRAA